MMSFDELFDNFFTSENKLNEDIENLKKPSLYDDNFLEITKNEDKGTAFFQKFIPEANTSLGNPPFEVSPFKTFVLSERPDLLRQ